MLPTVARAQSRKVSVSDAACDGCTAKTEIKLLGKRIDTTPTPGTMSRLQASRWYLENSMRLRDLLNGAESLGMSMRGKAYQAWQTLNDMQAAAVRDARSGGSRGFP